MCSWRRSVNFGTGVLRATGGQPSAPARSGVRMSTPEARRAAAKERLAASKGLSPREVEPMIQEAEPAPAVTAKTKSVLDMTPSEKKARMLEL